jgi:class 3 adenylate cyclase
MGTLDDKQDVRMLAACAGARLLVENSNTQFCRTSWVGVPTWALQPLDSIKRINRPSAAIVQTFHQTASKAIDTQQVMNRFVQSAPMMASQVRRSGLLRTVLFVDVCGSTKLYDTLGNTRAQAVIAKALSVLSQAANRHVGTIVKTIGDEVMCTFASAREAAAAAADMQRSVKQAVVNGDIDVKSLAVRVGFHSGPVISHSADVFGDTVNVAARLIAHAKPGQILFAKQTLRLLPSATGVDVRFVGSAEVKGKKGLFELFELIWDSDNLTAAQTIIKAAAGNTRATVRFGNTTVEVGFNRPVIRMGRGTENEIVVTDLLASRVHAQVEYRRDRVVLIDQSLNGTYLQMQGKSEVTLRRDEMALEGSGLISLGRSTSAQEHCVRFEVRNDTKVAGRTVLKKRSLR